MSLRKQDLDALTDNRISRLCYQQEYDDLYVVGKYSKSTYNGDGTWDVWLCNPTDIAAGLGQKAAFMARAIASSTMEAGPFTRLDGEGYYRAMPTATFLESLQILGVRRRKKFSDAHKAKLAKTAINKPDSSQKSRCTEAGSDGEAPDPSLPTSGGAA
jgi:hypothetical protein